MLPVYESFVFAIVKTLEATQEQRALRIFLSLKVKGKKNKLQNKIVHSI